MIARAWTPEETDTLRALVGHCPVETIAQRIGRSYNATQQRITRLGLGVRQQRHVPKPRTGSRKRDTDCWPGRP